MYKKLIFILIILLSVLAWDLYNSKKIDSKIAEENILALQDSVKYHKNKFGNEVASKLALQLTAKELQKSVKNGSIENNKLKEAIKKYKKVIATVQTTQEVTIDTIYIPFKDTIKCVFRKNFEIRDKWYQFNQTITNKGFKITDFKLTPNNQTVVFGWKKNGWFKNPQAVVEITNLSPLFKQTKIKPIIIVYHKKWYEKWYITIPSAFLIGKLF